MGDGRFKAEARRVRSVRYVRASTADCSPQPAIQNEDSGSSGDLNKVLHFSPLHVQGAGGFEQIKIKVGEDAHQP